MLAPINRNGDKGNTWKNYQVTTAEGFADAYHQFRDSGSVSLRARKTWAARACRRWWRWPPKKCGVPPICRFRWPRC